MFGWWKIFEATRLSDGEPSWLSSILPDGVEPQVLINAQTGHVDFQVFDYAT